MKHTKIFAGILLAAAAMSANAADINRTTTIVLDDTNNLFQGSFAAGNAGKTFLDIFSFTIPSTSTLGSSLTSRLSGNHNLNITSFGLYSSTGTLLTSGQQLSTGNLESWMLDALAPGQGTYSLRVGGTVIGNLSVAFTGDAYVTAVPEPETWSMMVGSLALVGFVARRRKSTARPLGGMAA